MYLSYIVTDIDSKLVENTEGWTTLRAYPMLSSLELFDPYEPVFKNIQELLITLGYQMVDNHVFINKHNPKMPKQIMFRYEELRDVVDLTAYTHLTERFTRLSRHTHLLVETIACKLLYDPSNKEFSEHEVKMMKEYFEKDPMLAP